MKLIEFEITCNFLATVFALLAGVNFLTNDKNWFLGFFGAAIVCLICAKWLELVERVHFCEELPEELYELEKILKCKGAI